MPEDPPEADDSLNAPAQSGEEEDVRRQWERRSAQLPGKARKSGFVRRVNMWEKGKADERAVPGGDKGGESRPPLSAGVTKEANRRPAARKEERSRRDPAEVGRESGQKREAVAPPGARLGGDPSLPVGSRDARKGTAAMKVPTVAPESEWSALQGSAGDEPVERRSRRRSELADEDDWTGQKLTLWWVLAGLGCVAVLAYALSYQMRKQSVPKRILDPVRATYKEDLETVAIRELVEASQDLVPIVIDLLEKIDGDPGGVGSIVRGGEGTVRLMEDWYRRQPRPAPFNPRFTMKLHAATLEGTGYLIMEGFRTDHSTMTAYVLEEDGRYLLDWQASMGYSELLPAEVPKLAGGEVRLMRVHASPANLYSAAFPEEDYQCYSISHLDPAEWVWAYAERGSLPDEGLRVAILSSSHGGTNRRATIKVRKGPDGARSNQVEVVEFLHVDWFSPGDERDAGQ